MSRVRIVIRECREDLPRELSVQIPALPIKDEPGTVVFPWPPTGEARSILKVYRRWNLAHWLRKRLMGFRVRREFHALMRLREAGVECVEPVFWGIGQAPDQGRFEVLATREVPAARSLREAVVEQSSETRQDVLGRLFESLARMHRAGLYHGAPFLENVLVQETPGATPAITILDLEKSVDFGGNVRGTRMAAFDLMNLVGSTKSRVGRVETRRALGCYGLSEAEMDGVFAALRAFRSSKFQRYRRRVEFLLRGWLTRGRRPAGTGRVPMRGDDLAKHGHCP